jgi:hypothetical protein
MSVNGVIVTLDQAYISGIDTTLVTKSPQFNATTEYLHNSIKMGTCLWNVTTATYMMGQTAQVLGGDLSYGNGDLYLDIQGGSVALNNDLTVGDDLFLTSGVFETTGYDVTAERFDSSTTTYTRSLWMGDSTFTLNDIAAATKWNVSATNMNVDSITSTIVFTNSAATTSTFTGGVGIAYNDFRIEGSGVYAAAFSAAATFHNLIVDRSVAAKTMSGAFTVTLTGELGIPIVGTTTVTITNTDFSMATGVVCTDWLVLTGSAAAGGGTFYAGANSTNVSGNSGWLFTNCSLPSVSTQDASSVTLDSATFNGTVVGMGSFTTVYGFFQYDKDGTFTSPFSNTEQTLTGTGAFDADVTDLDSEDTYYVRAALRYNVVSYVYGTSKSFVTGGQPVITTIGATEITTISATLLGSLSSMGNYSTVDVYFQYSLTGAFAGEETYTVADVKTVPGSFSKLILNLTPNETYYYRARADYSTDSHVNGTTLTFITMATHTPTTPTGPTTNTPTPYPGQTYVIRLGPTLAGWLDSIGALFGTDGKGFGGGLTFVVIMIIWLWLSSKGYPVAGGALTLPIQLGSAWIGLWDWAFVGVIVFLLAVVWVYKTWFEK